MSFVQRQQQQEQVLQHRSGRRLSLFLTGAAVVAFLLVIFRASPGSGISRGGRMGKSNILGSGLRRSHEDEPVGIAVVVMPSPQMVAAGRTSRMARLEAIRETWGQDLFMGGGALGKGVDENNRVVFVLDEGDPEAPDALWEWDHLDWPSADGGEESPEAKSPVYTRSLIIPNEVTGGGTDGDARLRYALGRVSAAYNPAFVLLCNEHTFVIAENLRCFVRGLDPLQPAYLGNRFLKADQGEEAVLNSGAAGFVLSRGSLSLLQTAWGQDFSLDRKTATFASAGGWSHAAPRQECVADSNFERANPGVTLARCLKTVGVEAQDTTDAEGGQRFNAFGPVRLARGKIDKWYKDVHATDPGMWRAGSACCASDTISFHYVEAAETRAMHFILHNRSRFINKGGYTEAIRAWPSNPAELGGFAAAPREGDGTFDLLLNKINICSY